jgi:hypothetical protein
MLQGRCSSILNHYLLQTPFQMLDVFVDDILHPRQRFWLVFSTRTVFCCFRLLQQRFSWLPLLRCVVSYVAHCLCNIWLFYFLGSGECIHWARSLARPLMHFFWLTSVHESINLHGLHKPTWVMHTDTTVLESLRKIKFQYQGEERNISVYIRNVVYRRMVSKSSGM